MTLRNVGKYLKRKVRALGKDSGTHGRAFRGMFSFRSVLYIHALLTSAGEGYDFFLVRRDDLRRFDIERESRSLGQLFRDGTTLAVRTTSLETKRGFGTIEDAKVWVFFEFYCYVCRSEKRVWQPPGFRATRMKRRSDTRSKCGKRSSHNDSVMRVRKRSV